MTSAEVAMRVRAELVTNPELLEHLKQGDPSAFEKLDLNFEQIYASTRQQPPGAMAWLQQCPWWYSCHGITCVSVFSNAAPIAPQKSNQEIFE